MSYFPHSWPVPDPEGVTPTAVFTTLAANVGPPWLRRAMSTRIMQALLAPLDAIADAVTSGIKARFPQWRLPDALAVLGRERRIRRGVGEPADVYAARLVQWLDSHRGRGGPHTLLRQMREYNRALYTGPIAALSHAGVLYEMTGDEIARSRIIWGADGTTAWAQVWVLVTLPSAPPLALSDVEGWRAIPREWSAAHILRSHVVLLWGLGGLWDYPTPPWATWDERDTAVAAITWDEWDAQQPPTITV